MSEKGLLPIKRIFCNQCSL